MNPKFHHWIHKLGVKKKFIMPYDEMRPVHEILERGPHACISCFQRKGIYHRALRAHHVIGMANLARASIKNFGDPYDFVHIDEFIPKVNRSRAGSDFNVTHYFGLAETMIEEVKDKPMSGKWALTSRGILFLKGKLLIPKKAKLYNNKVFDYHEETIGIEDVLKKQKFSYTEVLTGLEL